MTSTNDNRFFVPAWGVSLAVHGVVVSVAFVLSTQVKPILEEEVFQWDVALVDAAKPAVPPQSVESTVASSQPIEKKYTSSHPKPVVESSQRVMPMERHIDTPPPMIEQKVEVPQVREEPMAQRIVETVPPVAEPTVEPKMAEPVGTAMSTEPAGSHPVQQEAAIESVPVSSSDVSVLQERTVDAVATSGPAAKTDNRWLAESLWRRVAELKRYPNQARMNGQEGKVILKAVIRADGQLAEVSVQKSSGHSVLDAAAMEAVKLACPLHMKHAIGKPLIVVSLPIVYSLAN